MRVNEAFSILAQSRVRGARGARGSNFMRMRRLGFLALPVLAIGLAGCESAATMAVSHQIVAAVDRTISDFAQKDCQVARLMSGDAPCEAHAPPPEPEPVYCFKTLGRPDCYNTPNPYRPVRATEVATPRASALERSAFEDTIERVGQMPPRRAGLPPLPRPRPALTSVLTPSPV